jgi:hypothetical protein
MLGALQQVLRLCLYLLVDSGGVGVGDGAAAEGVGSVFPGSGVAEADGAA